MEPQASLVFRQRLREERERAGFSQMELARLMTERLSARIDSTTVTRMERGERTVRLDEAVVAAEVLGVPLPNMLNAAGTGLLAKIDDVRFRLDGAQRELETAVAEVERWRNRVDELSEELEGLEERQQAEHKAEVERDLMEEFRISSGPR